MNFETFSRRAEEIFEEIPPDYRQGVDSIEVLRKTVTHPDLPEVYTLGECLSEFYPSDYGGPGDVQSRVVLYYGSFLELARTHDDWDWEGELFETVTHEVRHHLEHLASEDALEEMDYAEDQNFARREGERFDPFFFKSGHVVEGDAYEVDGDVFIEQVIDSRRLTAEGFLDVEFGAERWRVRAPRDLGDVHFMRIPEPGDRVEGELFVVLVRRRGAMEWIAGLLKQQPLRIVESDAELEGRQ